MDLNVAIQELQLEPIFTLNQGSAMKKGGRKANTLFFADCVKVPDRFLCYYWKSGATVYYVGSVTKDYKEKKNNLVGRIGNYLQNHSNGNQNSRVFANVNKLLSAAAVEFGVFRFTNLFIDSMVIKYSDCAVDGDITYMIENLLIGYYKTINQCQWNL